jgi:hypothetical protein
VSKQHQAGNLRQVNEDLQNSAQQSPALVLGSNSGRNPGAGEQNRPNDQMFREIQDSSQEYQTAEFFARDVHHPSAN